MATRTRMSTVHEYPIDISYLLALQDRMTGGSSRVAETVEDRLARRMAWETVLVSQTVDYAVRTVPFYQDLARSLTRPLRTVDELRALPIVGKKELNAYGKAFLSEAVAATRVRYTSGTSARDLAVYGCEEESAAHNALLTAVYGGSTNPQRDIILRITPPIHKASGATGGGGIPTLSVVFDYYSPPFESFDFEDVVLQCLTEEYHLAGTHGRVSLLHFLPPFMLAYVTEMLLIRGAELDRFPIRAIQVTGTHLTPRIREFASRAWGVPVAATYSSQEVRGGATECPAQNGVYHFDETIFVEVVDLATGEPCGPGEAGALLLTSLYPFQQAMPFLRYRIGDVAQVVDRPCQCGSVARSVRVLGRIGQCIDWRPVTGRREFLGTVQLENAFSAFTEVPHLPYARFDWQYAMLPGSGAVLTVEVEVTADAHARAQQGGSDLASRIREQVLKEIPLLAHAVEQGATSVEVQLVRKGELANHLTLKG